MYNNTISGTATEKGGNDNINTIRRRFFFHTYKSVPQPFPCNTVTQLEIYTLSDFQVHIN